MQGKAAAFTKGTMSISSSYKQYLKSDHWQNLRLEKLVKTGAKCHFCQEESPSNDVHHVKYPSNLKDTKLKHLRVLCRRCHNLVHEILDEFPAIKKLNNSRSIWRVTDQHVRRRLGIKIVFHKETSGDVKFALACMESGRKRLKEARVYGHEEFKCHQLKKMCPMSEELALWIYDNPNSTHEEVLLKSSELAGTGLTMRSLTKFPRVLAWRAWRKHDWMCHHRPELGLTPIPQPPTWDSLNAEHQNVSHPSK